MHKKLIASVILPLALGILLIAPLTGAATRGLSEYSQTELRFILVLGPPYFESIYGPTEGFLTTLRPISCSGSSCAVQFKTKVSGVGCNYEALITLSIPDPKNIVPEKEWVPAKIARCEVTESGEGQACFGNAVMKGCYAEPPYSLISRAGSTPIQGSAISDPTPIKDKKIPNPIFIVVVMLASLSFIAVIKGKLKMSRILNDKGGRAEVITGREAIIKWANEQLEKSESIREKWRILRRTAKSLKWLRLGKKFGRRLLKGAVKKIPVIGAALLILDLAVMPLAACGSGIYTYEKGSKMMGCLEEGDEYLQDLADNSLAIWSGKQIYAALPGGLKPSEVEKPYVFSGFLAREPAFAGLNKIYFIFEVGDLEERKETIAVGEWIVYPDSFDPSEKVS